MKARKLVVLLLVLLALAGPVLSDGPAQITPPAQLQAQGAVSGARLSPKVNRTSLLQTALGKLRLSPQEKTKLTEQFTALPADAQDVALASVDSTYAVKIGYKPNIKLDNIRRVDLLVPYIDHFYPETGGQVWTWVVVFGGNFTANSKVYIDNKPTATNPWGDNLIFAVPSNTTAGVDHTICVKDTDPAKESAGVPYRIVAYKGYRGVHGWKFENFCTPIIGWNIYRDYFTPAAVEYTDGTHRPSAQYWYDYTYKTIAAGGDCFGMSVRSIRTKLQDWRGINGSWWLGNVKDCVWNYNSCNEILDCVRQDQAGQLCRQTWGIMGARWNQRWNANAWTDYIQNCLNSNDPQQQPILCMYKSGHYGHAVIAWEVNELNGARYIPLYNNNNPYAENEGTEGDYATVYRSNNTFNYNGYNEMFPLTFAEATPAVPLLPVGVGASTAGSTGAADITVVVTEVGNEVKQITDENGRTFYAGTQENRNEATRIPGSMRFIPMCASSTPVPLPADFPGIYVFTNSTGKSLKFDLARPTTRRLTVFSVDKVMNLTGGSGSVTLRNLQKPEQSIEVAEPAKMNVQEINVISVEQDRTERVYKLNNASTVQQNLSVKLTTGAAGLNVSNGGGAEADLGLSIQQFSNSGTRTAPASRVKIPANQQGLISPNFTNLQQAPKIELRPK